VYAENLLERDNTFLSAFRSLKGDLVSVGKKKSVRGYKKSIIMH